MFKSSALIHQTSLIKEDTKIFENQQSRIIPSRLSSITRRPATPLVVERKSHSPNGGFEEAGKVNDPTPGLRKSKISKLESILSGKTSSAFTPIDSSRRPFRQQSLAGGANNQSESAWAYLKRGGSQTRFEAEEPHFGNQVR